MRGDIIKFGRVQLKVKDYRISEAANESDKVLENSNSQISSVNEDGPVDIKECDAISK